MESTRKLVLPNGLVVLVSPRVGVGSAAVMLLYKVGSRHDPAGQTGIAHLMEHMMFRGTGAFPAGAIDSATAAAGGVNNATTTADHTAYYFVLPSEHWRLPLEIEADRMSNCVLDERAFETERRIAVHERNMLDDDPESILDEAIERLAFRRHPYRNPVVGLHEDLERVNLGNLQAHYASYYVPNNAVLVVVGDVNPDEVARAADELFGPIDARDVPVPEPCTEPPQEAPRKVEVPSEHASQQAVVAFRCPRATDRSAPELEVLATLLATGTGSVLHRRLVESRELTADVSAYRLLQADPTLFHVAAHLHPDADPLEFLNVVLDVLEELKDGGASEGELATARSLARLDLLLGRETCLGLAGALGLWESLDRWEAAADFERRMLEMTRDDVRRVVNEHFGSETWSAAWLVPRTA
jgi:zinc protease